jgi:hypothetical protein
MVGPRRSATTSADPRRSAADAPPQSGNGDAPETSQVNLRPAPDHVSGEGASGTPASAPAYPEQQRPTQLPGPSRIKVLGCEINDPHLLRPHQIARIVILFWALRAPPLLLVLVATYKYNLKAVTAHAENLQLNYGELTTVAVCVALFIVLTVILIPRRRRRGGRHDDESPR